MFCVFVFCCLRLRPVFCVFGVADDWRKHWYESIRVCSFRCLFACVLPWVEICGTPNNAINNSSAGRAIFGAVTYAKSEGPLTVIVYVHYHCERALRLCICDSTKNSPSGGGIIYCIIGCPTNLNPGQDTREQTTKRTHTN